MSNLYYSLLNFFLKKKHASTNYKEPEQHFAPLNLAYMEATNLLLSRTSTAQTQRQVLVLTLFFPFQYARTHTIDPLIPYSNS